MTIALCVCRSWFPMKTAPARACTTNTRSLDCSAQYLRYFKTMQKNRQREINLSISCTRCPCPVFPEKSSYQAGLSSIVPNIPVFLWTVLFPRSEERSVPLWWWICSYWEQKLNQQVKETAFIGFVWNVTTSFMICLTSIQTELETRTADILYLPVHKNVVHKSWSWTLKLKKYNACRCCDAQKLK